MLGYIRTMKVIMVFHRSLVLVVDLNKKLQELVVVDSLQQIILLKEWSSHKWHLHVSTNLLWELEYVEFKSVDLVVEVLMFVNEFINMIDLQVEINSIRVDSNVFEVGGDVWCVMPVRWFHLYFNINYPVLIMLIFNWVELY